MKGKEIYKVFAQRDNIWASFVRPVAFVAIDTYSRMPLTDFVDRKALFMQTYEKDTAIFVDLAGRESIELGIDLAKKGYVIVPLFNGTDEPKGAKATSNTELTERALINASERLKNVTTDKKANPVFLLDNLRLNRYRAKENIFDNSWDLYEHDIASKEFFLQDGIKKIIVVSDKVHRDLRKIFFKFQKVGIDIYLSNGYEKAKKVKLVKTLKERLEKEEL